MSTAPPDAAPAPQPQPEPGAAPRPDLIALEQVSVHGGHNNKTIAQELKEAEGKAGAPVKIGAFARFALGEGIEKDDGPDFAAEVAAAAGQG